MSVTSYRSTARRTDVESIALPGSGVISSISSLTRLSSPAEVTSADTTGGRGSAPDGSTTAVSGCPPPHAVIINRAFGGGGAFKRLSQVDFPEWASEFDAESWGQFLLKYALSHPAVTCVIPGMTKSRHVVDNMGAARGRMPDADTRRRMEAFFDALPG